MFHSGFDPSEQERRHVRHGRALPWTHWKAVSVDPGASAPPPTRCGNHRSVLGAVAAVTITPLLADTRAAPLRPPGRCPLASNAVASPAGPRASGIHSARRHVATRIIARMPSLIASGSVGQASTTAARSMSNRPSSVPSAPDSAPLLYAIANFPAFLGGLSNPVPATLQRTPGSPCATPGVFHARRFPGNGHEFSDRGRSASGPWSVSPLEAV